MKTFQHLINIILITITSIQSLYSQNTLVLRPDGMFGKDALIRSLSPNTNFGNNIDFNAHAWTNYGDPVVHRSLIEFDLSLIPVNATIINAYLSLYSYDSPIIGPHSNLSGSNEAVIQQVIGNWDENTITWANQPNTTSVNQIILPQSNNAIQDYLNIDVTVMILNMINNPSTGHGFLFKLTNEQHYRRMLFASSDNPDPNLRPKLEIVYTLYNSGYINNTDTTNYDNHCKVKVPNVFTPDNNGMNDYFRPIFECEYNDYELTIFNRWGEIIFQSNDYIKYWDGTIKGSMAPTGEYFYLFKYTLNGSSYYQRKGYLTLLKNN